MLRCHGFEVNHTTTSPVDALPMKASNSCMIEIRIKAGSLSGDPAFYLITTTTNRDMILIY
jgi:hypothetical protein